MWTCFSLGTIIANTRPLLLKSQAFYFQVMVPVSLTLTPLFAGAFLAVFSKRKRGELSRRPICCSLHQHRVPVKSSKSTEKNLICLFWLRAKRSCPLSPGRRIFQYTPGTGAGCHQSSCVREALVGLRINRGRLACFSLCLAGDTCSSPQWWRRPVGLFSSTYTCTCILKHCRCVSAYV